jgi:hypothetical protein
VGSGEGITEAKSYPRRNSAERRNLVLLTSSLGAQSPKLKTRKRFHILLQFDVVMKAAMQQPADNISLAYITVA